MFVSGKEIEKQGAAVRRKDYEEVPLNKQQTEALYESEARSRERAREDYPNAGILNAGISQIIIIFEDNE